MKAIVLSFDPHLEIANLVVETYNRLWPNCPFVFRIPFTDRDPRTVFAAQNVEFVQTPSDIRRTMQNLLRGLPEDEFIFWCVDDRYPIAIFDLPVLRAAYDFVTGKPAKVDSIKWTDIRVAGAHRKRDAKRQLLAHILALFRPRSTEAPDRDTEWRQREEATPRAPAFVLAGQHFFRQLGHPKNGFYMPQFTTPAFLKRFFFAPALPLLYGIREFHHFLLGTEFEHESYFPDRFLVSTAESTFQGQLSASCYEQILKLGLSLPTMPVRKDYKVYSQQPPQ
jgi:hypothetical protein